MLPNNVTYISLSTVVDMYLDVACGITNNAFNCQQTAIVDTLLQSNKYIHKQRSSYPCVCIRGVSHYRGNTHKMSFRKHIFFTPSDIPTDTYTHIRTLTVIESALSVRAAAAPAAEPWTLTRSVLAEDCYDVLGIIAAEGNTPQVIKVTEEEQHKK